MKTINCCFLIALIILFLQLTSSIQIKKNDKTLITAKDGRNVAPIVINERDLIEEVKDIFGPNKARDPLTPGLLDTSYDNVAENLLLDINMHFEEHLQENIEHDHHFLEAIKKIVRTIKDNLYIESLADVNLDDLKTVRSNRIKWIANYIYNAHSDAINTKFNVNNIDEFFNIINDKMDFKALSSVTSGKANGYVGVLKMLINQLPYFGGSVEYYTGEENIEFYIYHISSLTKDPDRSYLFSADATPLEKKLPKPLMDYVTYPAGLLPYHNQRNLGVNIDELKWVEIPNQLREEMLAAFNELAKKNSEIVNTEGLLVSDGIDNEKESDLERIEFFNKLTAGTTLKLEEYPDDSEIALFWDNNEKKRTSFNQDVLRLSWSNSHILDKDKEEERPVARASILKLPYRDDDGLENVVGVRENILEIPEKAGEKYLAQLKNIFPDGIVPGGVFSDSGMNEDQPVEFYAKQFVDLHTDWFVKCKAAHKPIIGGISGHTLGYLNIYKNALDSLLNKGGNVEGLPSLDTFRAIMLAALVGNKRHHSYDEVFAAADSMPDPVTNKVLAYAHRNSYNDVLNSEESNIKQAAEIALNKTIEDVENPEPAITVLDYIKKEIFGDNNNDFIELTKLLKSYLKSQADPSLDIENFTKEILTFLNNKISELKE